MNAPNNQCGAAITAIEYYLPDTIVTNADLAAEFPKWSIEKLQEKTGIRERHIAAPGECSSDLAVAAAERLFASGAVERADIDAILLCTQTPDYLLPTTACLVQERLRIPTTAGALDFNLGCSGFVYGLGLAKGLIESGQAEKVLLLTAETYSKLIQAGDRSVQTLFGDGAAATLVQAVPRNVDGPYIEPLVWGTDGRGAANLIVAEGAARTPQYTAETSAAGHDGRFLYMNGPEIFNFTVQTVPALVHDVLQRAGKELGDIDLFVFHQASKLLLDHLRRKLSIAPDRFYISLEGCGNTVSSTIPIALRRASLEGVLKPRNLVLLAGFGVGYSWAGTLVRWPDLNQQ